MQRKMSHCRQANSGACLASPCVSVGGSLRHAGRCSDQEKDMWGSLGYQWCRAVQLWPHSCKIYCVAKYGCKSLSGAATWTELTHQGPACLPSPFSGDARHSYHWDMHLLTMAVANKTWRSWGDDVAQAARQAQPWSWWQSAQPRSSSGTARQSSLCPAGRPKWPWPEQPAGLLHWGGCRAEGKRYWHCILAGQGTGQVLCLVSAGADHRLQGRPQVARMICSAVEALPGSEQPKRSAVLGNKLQDNLLTQEASGSAGTWLGCHPVLQQACACHAESSVTQAGWSGGLRAWLCKLADLTKGP